MRIPYRKRKKRVFQASVWQPTISVALYFRCLWVSPTSQEIFFINPLTGGSHLVKHKKTISIGTHKKRHTPAFGKKCCTYDLLWRILIKECFSVVRQVQEEYLALFASPKRFVTWNCHTIFFRSSLTQLVISFSYNFSTQCACPFVSFSRSFQGAIFHHVF